MPASAKNSETAATSETTFEAAMERLEKIVAQMESAQMPLDELLERYEEGTSLIAVCQGKLQAAEQRIEMVTRKASAPSASLASSAAPLTQENESDVSLF